MDEMDEMDETNEPPGRRKKLCMERMGRSEGGRGQGGLCGGSVRLGAREEGANKASASGSAGLARDRRVRIDPPSVSPSW